MTQSEPCAQKLSQSELKTIHEQQRILSQDSHVVRLNYEVALLLEKDQAVATLVDYVAG